MNTATLPNFNHDIGADAASNVRIARVEVFTDMAEAEPHWRALQAADPLATPYQAFDFLNLWHRHIGEAEGVTPFIVTDVARLVLLAVFPGIVLFLPRLLGSV